MFILLGLGWEGGCIIWINLEGWLLTRLLGGVWGKYLWAVKSYALITVSDGLWLHVLFKGLGGLR